MFIDIQLYIAVLIT